ncbi:MAG: MBL fold metallo-hydrolase [bacterium]|nr:MBL fold metallo-hydrolase [bacterium]
MKQVADNIYRLGTAHHNFYLLTEGGKATVIDAGCSKELPKLEEGLASIGLMRDDVEAIILTHAHADHIGFAAEAQKSGTEVRTHEVEAPIATGDVEGHAVKIPQLPLHKLGTWKFLIALLKEGITKAPRIESVVTFSDGDVLELPGNPRVVYTPGHTIGHSSFYLRDSKTLFSGDALVTRDLITQAAGPQMLPDMFHTDPARARESLDVLAGFPTNVVLPGHGDQHLGSVAAAVEIAKR